MNGDLRSTKFAMASRAASNLSPERTIASEGSASITASQVPTSFRPSKSKSACSQRRSARPGSNCEPLRLRAISFAPSMPPTLWPTSTNSES